MPKRGCIVYAVIATIRRVTLLLCAAIAVLVAIVYFNQHSLIYHPRAYDGSYTVPMSSVIELDYLMPFGKQVAFYAPPRSKQTPERVWIAFCGNGSLALDWVTILAGYPNATDAFLMIDYPGYGKNQGYATIDSMRASSDAALQALGKQLNLSDSEVEGRLCAIGHSLGAGVALDFAAHHHVQRLLVVSPFTTLREEAAVVSGSWLAMLLIESYDNRTHLREILHDSPGTKLAIFHGDRDELIPVRMGAELNRLAPDRVNFFPIAGGDHVSVLSLAHDEMIRWMNE